MCQVPALIEAHRHDGVAGLDKREIGRQVRVRACVRLDVGMLRAEQLHRPRAGEVLHLVSDGVTAVVTPTGVTLGVLVRQHRGGGREHGGRREVLRRDQLKVGSLPLDLALEQCVHLGVPGERARQEGARTRCLDGRCCHLLAP